MHISLNTGVFGVYIPEIPILDGLPLTRLAYSKALRLVL